MLYYNVNENQAYTIWLKFSRHSTKCLKFGINFYTKWLNWHIKDFLYVSMLTIDIFFVYLQMAYSSWVLDIAWMTRHDKPFIWEISLLKSQWIYHWSLLDYTFVLPNSVRLNPLSARWNWNKSIDDAAIFLNLTLKF